MKTNLPYTNYNKEKVEGYKLEIQQILGALDVPRAPPDENITAETTDSVGTPITPAAEGGMALIIPSFNYLLIMTPQPYGA